jgi:hypothetical protein
MRVITMLLAFLFASNVAADGLIRTTDLKKYCGQEGINRQTVFYLDQSIIAKKDTNWFRDILNKAKFLPGERIQVVTIKEGGSTVEQAWDTCYPAYTSQNYNAVKKNEGFGSVFTGGIDDALKNDSKAFITRLQQALAHPLQQTRHEQAPKYEREFPRKKLVEAFYYDSKRLDLKNGIARVIVFSDMIENSDLVKHVSFDPIKDAASVSERFPVFFNHASFYIYGINYTNSDTALNEKMERFWRQYFIKSGAEIAHYGTQLVLPRADGMFSAVSYKGKLTQSDGKRLATAMRLAYLPNGDLIHSWLSVGDNFMTLSGNISCSGQNCEVDAKIKESGFEYFKPNDVVKLGGTLSDMRGQIGARDDSVIDEKGKIYRFDIEFEQEPNLSM